MKFLFARNSNFVDRVTSVAGAFSFVAGNWTICAVVILAGSALSVWGERRLAARDRVPA